MSSKPEFLLKSFTDLHVFTFFYLEDPFIIPAITLIGTTRSQTPGPITIHYNDSPENGPINPPIPFQKQMRYSFCRSMRLQLECYSRLD